MILPVTCVLQFSFFAPFADEPVGGVGFEADLCGGVLVGFAVEVFRKGREEVFVQSVTCGVFGCGRGLRGDMRQVEEDFCVVAYEREGYGSGGGVVAVETCGSSSKLPFSCMRRADSITAKGRVLDLKTVESGVEVVLRLRGKTETEVFVLGEEVV